MEEADLKHRFQFHPADQQNTADAHEEIRASCLRLAGTINELAPDGREKSTAVTKLEEAMMWANAAIARGDGPKD
jgi:hypothetical protein